MPQILIMDPASVGRSSYHEMYGSAADALNGSISRIFLTGVPQSVPTTDCRQPDAWSCGPYALAECLGQPDGEDARNWLLNRGLINQQQGTYYSGIVGYLNSCGYSCEYDGTAHDGEMSSPALDAVVNHLNSGYKVILCMHGTSKGGRTNYWTSSGHYITAYGIKDGGIVIDGFWGCDTTKLAQKILHTTADGKISGQNKIMIPNLPNCQPASWKFVEKKKLKNGSELIRAIQRLINVPDDGFFGIVSIVAFQKFLSVPADGFVGGETVKAWQRWLNNHVYMI